MRKKAVHIRTREEIKEEFARRGLSLSAWATEHGFNRTLVHHVLNNRCAGRIGQSHKIAVLLGLKDGEIVT